MSFNSGYDPDLTRPRRANRIFMLLIGALAIFMIYSIATAPTIKETWLVGCPTYKGEVYRSFSKAIPSKGQASWYTGDNVLIKLPEDQCVWVMTAREELP